MIWNINKNKINSNKWVQAAGLLTKTITNIFVDWYEAKI